MSDENYILRPRDREELERLEFQHQVWKTETDSVLLHAGFKSADRVLDVGCGPGFLALDLANLVGPEGSVLGVDTSDLFIRHLARRAETRQLRWLEAVVGDARGLDLGASSLDGAICRWVLMFVSRPEQVVARVAAALRPGGVFAVMEYAQFRATALWPEGRRFRQVYDAVHELIANGGGDADVGGRVPSLLMRSGFEIVDLLPMWRVGRPGSDLWRWLEGTHPNHHNLVEAGLISVAELEDYLSEWHEHAENPAALFAAPPVLATIARKR